MKHFLFASIVAQLLFASACSDNSSEAKKNSDAKARADAAKKEMETLPNVFSTPDYYKKNLPARAQPASPKISDSEKK